MARPEDNTAKKLSSFAPSTEEVDAGWDVVAEEIKEAEGLDKFLYAPEAIRPEVARAALEVIKDIEVGAEDCLKLAPDALGDILEREGISYAPLVLEGGVETSEVHGDIKAAEGTFALSLTPGGIAENRDAVLVDRDTKRKKTTIVLAHGPQNDPLAANLANAAVLKAGAELALGKNEPLYYRGGKINDNVDAVKEEFGLQQKDVDFAIAELSKPEFSPSYDLEIVSKGPIHCYLINPDENRVETYDVERVHVDRDDLMQLFRKIETPEAMKDLVERTETDDEVKKILYRINVGLKTEPDVFPRFREKVYVAMVKQKLNDAGREALDEYLAQRHLQGSSPDQIVDVVYDFLKSPGRQQMKVELGDIIVLATDELVQSMGQKQKTGYDIPFADRFLLEIQGNTPLEDICRDIVGEYREKQQKEQVPEAGCTLMAYKVALPEPTKEEAESLVKEYMGDVPEDIREEAEEFADEAKEELEEMKERKVK